MCHKNWESDLETSVDDWHDMYSMSCAIAFSVFMTHNRLLSNSLNKWFIKLYTMFVFFFCFSAILLHIRSWRYKTTNFQPQPLHILLPCNSYLHKCGLNKAELCMETTKNMLHLFWNCNIVHNIWFAVKY
jgi:uncharacterized membrane protein YcgQ (UPF0703/DUF1980 family)